MILTKMSLNKYFQMYQWLILSLLISSRFGAQTIPDTLKTQRYSQCDTHYVYEYSKPKFWDMVTYVPKDVYQLGVYTVQNENLKWDALALGSTLLLIPFDQKLMTEADYLGQRLGGWDKDNQYTKLLGLLNIIPKNISSGVYYMGNGGTTLLLSGLFYGIGTGKNKDYRALNTSSELIECLLSVGVVTQTMKRITGRQSPKPAIADGNDGGNWSPFPSFDAFQTNTPNYDAMPSGHLATFMASITIIAINYPEKHWIKPVGYSLMTILSFNMVSSKVHWVSDYPIGLFVGYIMGKQIAERRLIKIAKDSKSMLTPFKKKYDINFHTRSFEHNLLLGCTVTF
ncbi:phosphatase PAP2 family protein [Flavobacterium sp.]|uniref:phosphatase PAP2 family protein n=2 Tax=Flavobacterium sp. TaxID=239 RepID=UPI002FD96A76